MAGRAHFCYPGAMSAAFILLGLLAQTAPEAPRPSPAGQDCHEIMGGTGGIHPIRTVCPAAERAMAEFGHRLKENGLIAGKACPGGFAYLRSGGDVNRLADYVCPEPKASDGSKP